jgi:hypothetical protein
MGVVTQETRGIHFVNRAPALLRSYPCVTIDALRIASRQMNFTIWFCIVVWGSHREEQTCPSTRDAQDYLFYEADVDYHWSLTLVGQKGPMSLPSTEGPISLPSTDERQPNVL